MRVPKGRNALPSATAASIHWNPAGGHGRHPVTQPTVKGITRVVDTLKLAKAYTFTMAAVTATSTGPAATFTAKTAAD